MSDPSPALRSAACYSVVDDQTELRLDLDQDQADKLSAQAVMALNSLPRRGLEIGGILLGHEVRSEDRLVIDGFREVACEHLFGPSYRLSEKDHLAWRDALTSLSSAGEESVPVGMFRSTTGEDFSLDEQDLAMIGVFRDVLASDSTERVFLLLKPSKNGENYGRFAIWNADRNRTLSPFPMWTRRSTKQVPVAESISSAGAVAAEPTPEKDAGIDPAVEQAVDPGIDEDTDVKPKRKVQFFKPSLLPNCSTAWIAVTAGVCVITVAVSFYLILNPGSPVVATEDLVTENGRQIEAQAPAKVIRGPQERIESGAVYEDPPADEMALESAPPIEMAVPLRPSPNPSATRSSANQSSEWPSGAVKKTGERAQHRGAQPEFTMQVDSPPKMHLLGSVWNVLSPMRLLRKIRGDGSTETARPTFAAEPTIPYKFRHLLQGGERVDVRVAINRNGKVVRAVAPKQGKQRWLTASAVAAAYQWEFRPAQISKEPVDSTALLHFVFQHPSNLK